MRKQDIRQNRVIVVPLPVEMMSANKLNIIHKSHVPTSSRTLPIHSTGVPGGYDQRVGAALAVRHWYTGKDAWSIIWDSECVIGSCLVQLFFWLGVEEGGKFGGEEKKTIEKWDKREEEIGRTK